jgi:predicted nucleic acid-binding protein
MNPPQADKPLNREPESLQMKIFFDTSVLVAAAVRHHEHFPRAFEAVQRACAGRHRPWVAAHSLLELYAVLTRLPVTPRIHPAEAGRMVDENVRARFEIVSLTCRMYAEVIRTASENGVAGGAVYDLLLLRAAAACNPDTIHTFNVAHFRRLAPELADRISAP